MNRRQFINISYFFTTILTFPFLNCSSSIDKNEILRTPEMLSSIINEEGIRKIGEEYRKQLKNGMSEIEFEKMILGNLMGNDLLINFSPEQLIRMIRNKIQKDFEEGRFKILNNWIISEIEAIQCALFSFKS